MEAALCAKQSSCAPVGEPVSRRLPPGTHFACAVPAVVSVHPGVLVPVEQPTHLAGLLAVAVLQLTESCLGIIQLQERFSGCNWCDLIAPSQQNE